MQSTIETGKSLILNKEMNKPEYKKLGLEQLQDLNRKTRDLMTELQPSTMPSRFEPYKKYVGKVISFLLVAAIFWQEVVPMLYGKKGKK